MDQAGVSSGDAPTGGGSVTGRRRWRLVAGAGLAAVVLAGIALAVFDGDDDPAASSDPGATRATGLGPAGDGDPAPASEAEPVLVTVPQVESSTKVDVPSALRDFRDPSFPPPLVDPFDVLSGGPPPDGIPPIDAPKFEPADTVTWLQDQEPVLLVEVDGEARAYPVQVMTWHELVNDTFGDRPVTVSYCPLCNTAIAYDRRLPDRELVLDFGTSGRLYNSALVMYDRQTESLWSHFTGQAVIGHLAGAELETLLVSTVSWAEFRAAHPEALVLSRETGFDRSYGSNPYPGYDDVNSTPFLFNREADPRLPAQTRVVSVQGERDSVALVTEYLHDERIVPLVVDDEDLVALLSRGTASALDAGQVAGGRDIGATGVFRPQADGRSLSFEVIDDTTFRDLETGSTWTILGEAIDGPLAGTRLERVSHLDTFWFAIAAFRPDTVVIEG